MDQIKLSPRETRRRRRIGILTSGGDAPGMNGVVRAVVRMAIAKGCDAYCIHEGYAGLVQGGNMIRKAEWDDVRQYLPQGGTCIGSARCDEFREWRGRLQAAQNLVDNGIDALVVCGGDGSLTGADLFRHEWPQLLKELVQHARLEPEQAKTCPQLSIVGLLGTIDNDMPSTDATIGCYSSLDRICHSVDCIYDTASSHQRAFVVEVMGRNCGWLALMAAISTAADFLFIPERPPGPEWKRDMCSVIKEHRQQGNRTTIVIISEGATDLNSNRIEAQAVKDILSTDLKLDTRITTLGHIQRGGVPCVYDRLLGTLQGAEAVNTLLESTAETPSSIISVVENRILRRPLAEAVKFAQDVKRSFRANDFEGAMRLRDPSFTECFDAFNKTTSLLDPNMILPREKQMRIAIIHVGKPCGGMNAATQAAVAYCLNRGHEPLCLYNGFSGLIRHHSDKPLGAVRGVSWQDTTSWMRKGGSEIGTNDVLPSENMSEVALALKKYAIEGLFLVGGIQAYNALIELDQARSTYSSMRIPMVLLPATIRNDVPGTEYCIGSDTCLNALVEYCDTCRQSASSSRRRAFVVDAKGATSGYNAIAAGLSVGALAVYTAEQGISAKMLDHDITFLREQFAKEHGQDRSGKIILRDDSSSTCFTADLIAKAITEEGAGRFDARVGIPGHFQQGRQTSPLDRIRAVRFAVRSLRHLETFAGKAGDDVATDPTSSAVIGIRHGKVAVSAVQELEREEHGQKMDTSEKDDGYMAALKNIGELLAGKSTSTASLAAAATVMPI